MQQHADQPPTTVLTAPGTGPQVPPQPRGTADRIAVSGFSARPPMVRQRRLMGLSVWALGLGLSGLVLGVVALVRIMTEAPGWFEPVFSVVGVVGLGLIVAAFVTVARRVTPWILMGASSALLVVGVVLLSQL